MNKNISFMNSIAEKISEARKTKSLTQGELAERSKVNVRTIQRIENSESEPRGATLKLICDVLQMDMKDLMSNESSPKNSNIGTRIVNVFFILALNLILMGIVGFLTLDSRANTNSVFGACLLSVFLPFFIVVMTKKMSGMERMLKFGFGYIIYFFIIMVTNGFPRGFVSGLFPCLLISLSVFYFGNTLLKNKD